MKFKPYIFWILFPLLNCLKIEAQNNIRTDSKDSSRQEQMEFSHPLITESISPDTKIRLTFLDTKGTDNKIAQTYDLELEYSPVPVFSIHLDVPYEVIHLSENQSASNFDEIEVDLKFANFAFARHNVLMGYGISFGLPTGNQDKGIGNNHVWDVNPFFNGGFKWKNWEWTAFFILGIPFNKSSTDNKQTALECRLTALYHFNNRWEGLIEAGNATQLSRFYKGDNSYDMTEGMKFRPNADKPWILGLGIRHPVFRNDEIKLQGIITVFYHFKD